MLTLKEVEAVERVRSKKEIDEEVYQRDLYYPYTVKKILNSTYYKGYTNTISKEQLDYLIKSIEDFCHCLHSTKQITSFNISNVAMFLIAKSEVVRNEIYDPNKELNYDFSERRKILYVILKQELEKISITEIEKDLINGRIIIDFSNESHESLETLNDIEIEEILFSILEKYDFCYADIITKVLLEFDLNDLIKFRKNSFYNDLEKSRYTFCVFLNYLNNMLYEINNLYERDGVFLYRMLETCVYTSDELKKIARDSFKCSDMKFCKEYCERLAFINRKFLIKGFIEGLLNIKELYLIEFAQYNNNDMKNFKMLSESDQYKYIEKICLNLEDTSIYFLYEIRKIKDKDIFNHLSKADKFVLDVLQKKKDILVTKQQLTEEDEKKVIKIKKMLEKNKLKYNIVDITFYDIKEIGRTVQLLTLNILLENNNYFVKLSKYNNDLIWYIYYNRKQIYREYCINTDDIERIYQLISKFNSNLIIRKKYKLI